MPIQVKYRFRNQDVALIFLHGFLGNTEATWASFPTFLANEPRITSWDLFGLGYPTSLRLDVRNIWSSDPDIRTLARELRTTLSLPPFSSYRKIAIAAHSMGGLIVQRAMVDDVALKNRLSHVFLFGTPSAGLVKAGFFSWSKRQISDMVADGPFIKSLRHEWTHEFARGMGFQFYVVAGDMDEFVPASSSLAPFSDNVQAVVPGNHSEIVKPVEPSHQSVQLIIDALAGGGNVRPIVDGARLALERSDFYETVKVLLPIAAELDKPALAGLALALEGLGRGSEALAILETHSGRDSTEALGVLAGRLKRRWLAERRAGDLNRAKELYQLGLNKAEAANDHEQALYHAINIAFLNLMEIPAAASIPTEIRIMAERALEHAKQVRNTNWSLATQGEAQLMLKDLERAEHFYAGAILATNSPREVDTIYSQAIRVAARVFGQDGASRIDQLFDLP
ncbi:Alpha/beta hydrolase family protein [Nitrosospira sp. Nsp14]|uniref:alpha/beta fold hydrolase n=1 Tax=Nitrosospira sp. Nsp14 TaxID=1855333 RepID=UPI0008E95993|nr:alpha/beta fold hydrolase [Nitrosospira sp. Nsp14]SFH60064.1 Alpha/beta hydrolase family protein [Nitrosospira sp. Nsp14]